jgi:hypothetical protein
VTCQGSFQLLKNLPTDKEMTQMKRPIMQYAHSTNYYDVGFAAMWQENQKRIKEVKKVR